MRCSHVTIRRPIAAPPPITIRGERRCYRRENGDDQRGAEGAKKANARVTARCADDGSAAMGDNGNNYNALTMARDNVKAQERQMKIWCGGDGMRGRQRSGVAL